MGYGTYSRSSYESEASTRSYKTRSTSEVFLKKDLDASVASSSFNTEARKYNEVDPAMLGVGVRECRDSEEHPNTTPIIIALDVTGSMRRTPHTMIKEHFPKIMDRLTELGIDDPQILFMAIGDHEYDDAPIQTMQFEGDTAKILDGIEKFYLEGGGGGNQGESYCLAWLMAGFHTETDSWYKRKKKGFLFTIGDEPCLKSISANYLINGLGYQKGVEDMTAIEALEKAREQYNVFHVHITNASRSYSSSWDELLGDNVLKCPSGEIDVVISEAIKDHLDTTQISTPSASIDEPVEKKEFKY